MNFKSFEGGLGAGIHNCGAPSEKNGREGLHHCGPDLKVQGLTQHALPHPLILQLACGLATYATIPHGSCVLAKQKKQERKNKRSHKQTKNRHFGRNARDQHFACEESVPNGKISYDNYTKQRGT